MNNYSNNTRSMNGLNNINASGGTFDDITTDTLTVNSSSSVPTRPNGDSTLNIANTTFVTSAISTAGTNYVNLNGIQTISGLKDFSVLPTSSLLCSSNSQFANKQYVDSVSASSVSLTGANAWTGNTNTFNSYLPTSTITAISANELVNLTTLNGAITTASSAYAKLASPNTFTSTNTFNTNLPTSTITAISANELVNLTTLNGAITTASSAYAKLASSNTFTSTNTFNTNTLTATAGITVKNGASSQTATLTQNSTTLDVIGSGDISIKPTNDFNVLTGTGKNITVSTPSTSLLQSTQTFTTGITNTTSYIALESPTTYITGLSTQPNLIIAGASGTIYGLKFTRGGTTLAAVNRINCSSTGDTFYLEVNSGTQITITNTAVTINPDDTFNMMPTATIIQNVSSTTPSGFLYCDGGAISRTTYSRLFGVIGTTYGVGDGSTTYNKPNFQSVFLRGCGSQTTGGVTYTAAALGTIQQDAVLNPLYASNEGFRSCASGARDCVSRDRITTDPTDTNTGILPRFDRTTTENRPVNHAVYYYIRY